MPREIGDAIQAYRGNLSTNSILNTLLMDGEFHSLDEAQQINRELATSLYRDVDFRGKSVDPDMSIELSAGNSWYFGGSEQWKFGVMGLGDYKNNWRNRERTIRSVTDPDIDFDEQLRTTNQVVVTGALGVGLDFADEHRVEVTGIFLRNTEDEASLTTGHNTNFARSSGLGIRNYRIRLRGTRAGAAPVPRHAHDRRRHARPARRLAWFRQGRRASSGITRMPRRTPTSRARCVSRRWTRWIPTRAS